MPADDALIAAMTKVVELDPDNVPIRLSLAKMYLKADQPEECLRQAQHILMDQPDHRAALMLGAEASAAMGNLARAESFQRMVEALGGRMMEDLEEFERAPAHSQPVEQPGNWHVQESGLTLKDVAGLENVKERLHLSFLGPMRSPELREAFGQTSRGGLLLYGPPGCGKTYLAKAIAGELGAGFLNVAISDVLDMWIGNSEKNIRAAFEAARKAKPCVLFFDEIDALGRKRSLTRHSLSTGVINQLLSEMDGVNSQNDGVFILAATNHPWDVDSAVRRPGRLDRMLLVSPPDLEARKAIAELVLAKKPHEDADLKWVAEKTDGFSGADVRLLCDAAAELALEESIKAGKICPIQNRHFKTAFKDVRPSMRPWFESAKNFALYSNAGGEYDELLAYLKSKRIL